MPLRGKEVPSTASQNPTVVSAPHLLTSDRCDSKGTRYVARASFRLDDGVTASRRQCGGRPQLPATDPAWYLRQDTWQETVRQSREALARYLKANPDSTLPGAPQGVTFSPWHVIGPFAPPARARTGSNSPTRPNRKSISPSSTTATAGNASTGLTVTGTTISTCPTIRRCTSTARSLPRSPAKVTVYVGCDDRAKVWLNGEQLLTVMHPSSGTGVELPLAQGENRLLVKIYNVTGGKAYSFSLTPNTKGGRSRGHQSRGDPVGAGRRDFRDPADQRQIRWEREDGIWDRRSGRRAISAAWPGGTRRRRASRSRWMRRPAKLAGKVADAQRLGRCSANCTTARGRSKRRRPASAGWTLPRCVARSPT